MDADRTSLLAWYRASLLQVAAESHFDGVDLGDRNTLAARLGRGNNPLPFDDTQYIRMVRRQATTFLDQYAVVDHHPNDWTGFSATLLRDRDSGRYTLAIRSTEYRDWLKGGDNARDSRSGASGQIAFTGFAVAQLAALDDYFRYLSQRYVLPAGSLDVVGYSLGGHLSLVFTELRPEQVGRTTIFNAPGHGTIARFDAPTLSDTASISEMLGYYRAVLLDPLAAATLVRSTPTRYRRAFDAFTSDGQRSPDARWNPFASTSPDRSAGPLLTVYEDSRHAWAMQAVRDRYALNSMAAFFIASGARTDLPGFDKITQLFGRATHGDSDFTANKGFHPPATSIFIEGQPSFEFDIARMIREPGLHRLLPSDYGNTHSLTLVIDSLATMLAFMEVDGALSKRQVEAILAASSETRPRGRAAVALTTTTNSESDSIERSLDALRFLYSAATPSGDLVGSRDWRTEPQRTLGGFGNPSARESFYDHLHLLSQAVAALGPARIVPLVPIELFSTTNGEPTGHVPFTETARAIAAGASAPNGIAYRHALKQLDPFVALDNGSLFDAHNRQRQLDLYDPLTSPDGGMSPRYIAERSAFLAHLLELNVANEQYLLRFVTSAVRYLDPSLDRSLFLFPLGHAVPAEASPDALFRLLDRSFLPARMVAFAHDSANAPLPSSNGDDALFGSTIADSLSGGPGDDYLEGGRGDDTLIGGVGDDTLFGGRDSDVLNGGLGHDTYVWNAGDGFDQIIDHSQNGTRHGEIHWRGTSLTGTKVRARADNPNLFTDPRGILYAYTGDPGSSAARLVIVEPGLAGGLTIPGFLSGDLGIVLDGRAPVERQPRYGTDQADVLTALAPGEQILGLAGNDTLILSTEAAEGLGGPGNDEINDGGHPGTQYLRGQSDNDNLNAAGGSDELDGGTGIDFLQGGDGDDYLDGGFSADLLAGGRGTDILVGGHGDDWLDGGSGARVTHELGDFDDPFARIDGQRWSVRFTAGVGFEFRGMDQLQWLDDEGDVLDGGLGDDLIWGGYGDDTAWGGDGRDSMNGGPGRDTLHGDAGDDALFGGPATVLGNTHYAPPETDGPDYLDGGAGDDHLIGYTGADHLLGDTGNDILQGDFADLAGTLHGADNLDGGEGNDQLFGQGAGDVLTGGPGNDLLVGDAGDLAIDLHGADQLDGGEGDDQLLGLGGADALAGGAGNDLLEGDSGSNRADAHGNDSLDGGEGNDTLTGGGRDDLLTGGAGDDRLFGDALELAPHLHGTDVLDGGEGDDLMVGGGGTDTLTGGAGTDTLHGDQPGDTSFGDADTLDGGDGVDRLEGGGGNDTLLGGAGNDTLHGDDGDDVLDGGPGDDLLYGGAGKDTFILRPGEGTDRIFDLSGSIDVVVGGTLTLADISASQPTSTGAASFPLLLGFADGTGARLDGPGLAGRVRLELSDGAALGVEELIAFSEAPATRRAHGTLADDTLRATAGTLLLGLNGDDELIGSSENDTLHGGEGNDVLDGAGGDDRLLGGAGDDVYILTRTSGADTIIETPGAGHDVLFIEDGVVPADVRFRRAGNDLVVRLGTSSARAEGWFVEGAGAPRGIDAVDFETGTLDVAAIEARVLADRTLTGTDGADTLQGDELDDTLIGGRGDDTLRGLAGNDVYRYALGDGHDAILDTGGHDTLELGAGIRPEEIALTATARPEGGLALVLTFTASGERITTAVDHRERIESFRFADGRELGFSQLVAIAGGLVQNGGAFNDLLTGSHHADRLYGHLGDDWIRAEPGDDLLAGGTGDDVLFGGTNDDTYVFELGDGRDRIVEYTGNDEYQLFRAAYTAAGTRYFVADGIVFAEFDEAVLASGGQGRSEVYHATLGQLVGGTDTIRFGPGIQPDHLSLGLRLLDETHPYTRWRPETGTTYTDFMPQVAYVLTVGAAGDAIEVVRPLPFGSPEALLSRAPDAEEVPLERLLFETGDTLTVPDLFARAGGWRRVEGSSAADRLTDTHLAYGAVLAGGGGNDLYLDPDRVGATVLETSVGGEDTIRLSDLVADASQLWPVFDQQVLSITHPSGRVVIGGFDPQTADVPLIEWFELTDGSRLEYAEVLGRGILVPGTRFDDDLGGTAMHDRIEADEGDDRLRGGRGLDWLDGGPGNDVLEAGADDDMLRGSRGNDRLQGGDGWNSYHYGAGDGTDLIEARPEGVAARGTIVLAAGLGPAHLRVTREAQNLVLEFATEGDRITLERWFDTTARSVDGVLFASGENWDAATLAAAALPSLPGGGALSGATGSGGAAGGSTGSGGSSAGSSATGGPASGSSAATGSTPGTGASGGSGSSEGNGVQPASGSSASSAGTSSGTLPPPSTGTAAGASASAETLLSPPEGAESPSPAAQAGVRSTDSLVDQAAVDALLPLARVDAATAPLDALIDSWFQPSNRLGRSGHGAVEQAPGESSERPVGLPNTSIDGTSPDAVTPSETARAWQAMHDQLDRLLAEPDQPTGLDIGAPGLRGLLPPPGAGLLAEALPGLADSGAVRLQSFSGLSEGLRVIG